MKNSEKNFIVIAIVLLMMLQLQTFAYIFNLSIQIANINGLCKDIIGSVSHPPDRIVQCVGIGSSDTFKEEIYSFSKEEWYEFLIQYPSNVTLSGIDLSIFSFKKVENILDFSEMWEKIEKISPRTEVLDYNLPIFNVKGTNLSAYYKQYDQRDGTRDRILKLSIENFELSIDNAVGGKKLYGKSEIGIEHLIFSIHGQLYALNEKLEVYEMSVQ